MPNDIDPRRKPMRRLTPEHQAIGFPTVLVVHEDHVFRSSVVSKLERARCLVLQAHDVESVIHVARTHSRRIHLVLIGVELDEQTFGLLQRYRPHTQFLTQRMDSAVIAWDRSITEVVQQVQRFLARGST